jgi:hypothetical protein
MIITIKQETIETFKQSWPCNGFPDNLVGIVICYDDNGNMVDLEGFDDDDYPIELEYVDRAALYAIIRAAKLGHKSQHNHNLVDTIRTY